MASKKDSVKSSVTIDFLTSGRVRVEIKNFEKITPARLEAALDHAIAEWGRLRREAIFERRRKEKEKEDVGRE